MTTRELIAELRANGLAAAFGAPETIEVLQQTRDAAGRTSDVWIEIPATQAGVQQHLAGRVT